MKMAKDNKKVSEVLKKLGVAPSVKKVTPFTKEEERIIAGFEEIQKFVQENGSPPQHGKDKDIFERIYATRLDRLNELSEYEELLKPLDKQNILHFQEKEEFKKNMNRQEVLATLGVAKEKNSINELKNVRTYAERRAAEDVGRRKKCEDFDKYKPLFEAVKRDQKNGSRKSIQVKGSTSIDKGDFFIINGQIAYIAELGEKKKIIYNRQNTERDNDRRSDRKIKVIYDNGTEGNMLKLSLSRAINNDSTSRKLVSVDDVLSGHIYILRSDSDHPFIKENRECIHKIGCTSGNIKDRIRSAKKDPTYLFADVELKGEVKLYNKIDPKKVEKLLHRFFSDARLNVELPDRFNNHYKPKEWFLLPLNIIKEAVDLFKNNILHEYKYDKKSVAIIKNS